MATLSLLTGVWSYVTGPTARRTPTAAGGTIITVGNSILGSGGADRKEKATCAGEIPAGGGVAT
jgi:hypothetical protein